MIQSATTGEFLVLKFTGSGQVILSSRNKKSLIQWLAANLPRN